MKARSMFFLGGMLALLVVTVVDVTVGAPATAATPPLEVVGQTQTEVMPASSGLPSPATGSLGRRPLEGACFINPRYCADEAAPHAVRTKCIKMAIAAGMIGAAGAAVATTPVDVPGMAMVGVISAGGTEYFCEVGWL